MGSGSGRGEGDGGVCRREGGGEKDEGSTQHYAFNTQGEVGVLW